MNLFPFPIEIVQMLKVIQSSFLLQEVQPDILTIPAATSTDVSFAVRVKGKVAMPYYCLREQHQL